MKARINAFMGFLLSVIPFVYCFALGMVFQQLIREAK